MLISPYKVLVNGLAPALIDTRQKAAQELKPIPHHHYTSPQHFMTTPTVFVNVLDSLPHPVPWQSICY